MNKKIAVCAVAFAFALGVAGSGYAAKVNCVVDTVEGDKVTMLCKDADKIAPGDKVKVATAKKGAIEGC
jgi:hypothetical protein